jgi:hypothetical protein
VLSSLLEGRDLPYSCIFPQGRYPSLLVFIGGRKAMSLLSWNLHGNGTSIKDGEVVKPDERLAWPLTIGVGVQHIAAMFGATFLVPIITGFPPSTTLFFSGVGT